MKDEPDQLFEVMGDFIINYKPDVDKKALKKGIDVLKDLYKAWGAQ